MSVVSFATLGSWVATKRYRCSEVASARPGRDFVFKHRLMAALCAHHQLIGADLMEIAGCKAAGKCPKAARKGSEKRFEQVVEK